MRVRLLLAALLTTLALPAAAPAADLRAGVGRADLTPPTGYAFGGWVRADRTGNGAQGRLNATALVLERDGRRVALVSAEVFAVFAPMVRDAAKLAGPGWSEENVIVSASHTHAGPAGFAPYDTYNTLAPSLETVTAPQTFVDFFETPPVDQRLYAHLVRRIGLAVRRATDRLGPAAAAWGGARLEDVTRNRSVEAHLNDHGIVREPGQGRAEEDPEGRLHTIDPEVSVLRVDRLVRRTRPCRSAPRRRCRVTARVPMGGWSMFANHGTVNPSEYEVYNNDHHAHANAVFEAGVRREGRVAASREVVNVYGNGNEGDQSAGLDGQGPVHAERVGRREGRAMLEAWRAAGARMSRRPALDLRWTRACFCGQRVAGGEVDDEPVLGAPFLTGSEEGRGPLFDVTKRSMEGDRAPTGFDSQGHKAAVRGVAGDVPRTVPLAVVRVGDRAIVTLPAEPTVEVGRRAKEAVLRALRPAGVESAVVSGLTGEFIQYLTTPEEYDRQHYEGGSTLFGRLASVALNEQLAELAARMASGREAQPPAPAAPTNGARADAPAFPAGAEDGRITREPEERATGSALLAWRGGPNGLDLPLDQPFITVERRGADGAWRAVTDDRGLDIVWRTDHRGAYDAAWEVPAEAAPGEHRFVVTANRYRLTSRAFSLRR
jgi:neutral ceramidase